MRKITVIPDSSHKVYYVRNVNDGFKDSHLILDINDGTQMYSVYGTIEFFYTELIGESDKYMLLKTLSMGKELLDDTLYFIVNKSSMMTCNDIYVPNEATITLVDDHIDIEIDNGYRSEHIWSCWWNEATDEQIKETVLGITSVPDDILIYQNIVREAFYFLYCSDVRNKYLTVYDKDTHSLLAQIK